MLAWLLPSTLLAAALPGTSAGGFLEAGRLAVGFNHSCVVTGDGGVLCWGSNHAGQLGDGTYDDRSTPTPVVGLKDAVAITAGYEHTCARLRDASVVCWGADDESQLGGGAAPKETPKEAVLRRRRGEEGPSRPTPGPVVDLGPADAIVAHYGSTCALVSREIWCWGSRVDGDGVRAKPKRLDGFPPADEVAFGSNYVCARSGGVVTCRAEDSNTWKLEPAPAPIADLEDATALAGGNRHLCVLRSSGGVTCYGQIPYLYERDRFRVKYAWRNPTVIAEITDAVALASGSSHACAVRRGGEVRCWGDGLSGQLGHGLYQPWRRPVVVADLRKPRAIAPGNGHTCALSEAGAVLCWGANGAGQLGWSPPTVKVPELQAGRRGRDEATWQLEGMIRSSATPQVAWSPPT